jgi:hypothetical protein
MKLGGKDGATVCRGEKINANILVVGKMSFLSWKQGFKINGSLLKI